MIYFIAVDHYNHISRNWLGFKKKNAPAEQRPMAIAVVSEEGEEFYSDSKNKSIILLRKWLIGRTYDFLSVDEPIPFSITDKIPVTIRDNWNKLAEWRMHLVPDEEFTHDNLNYPNCITLLPGQHLKDLDKFELLEEHKDWQHTAPGELSLERARKARNNYLLLKSITEKYKK